jgi:hypothetical protein
MGMNMRGSAVSNKKLYSIFIKASLGTLAKSSSKARNPRARL